MARARIAVAKLMLSTVHLIKSCPQDHETRIKHPLVFDRAEWLHGLLAANLADVPPTLGAPIKFNTPIFMNKDVVVDSPLHPPSMTLEEKEQFLLDFEPDDITGELKEGREWKWVYPVAHPVRRFSSYRGI